MKEICNILTAFKELSRTTEYGVLASVVQTTGSTYRRPGARALFLADDKIIGLIGGGCLEADLLDQARSIRVSGKPKRVRYDNTSDTDIVWGLGLGCAGVVDVLLEPVNVNNPGPLNFIAQCVNECQPGIMATVIDSDRKDVAPLAARWMQKVDGLTATIGAWETPSSLLSEARHVLADGKSKVLCEGGVEILVERILPLTRLVIFGANADAIPMVGIASQLGWSVEVIDHRPGFARPERFPGASRVEQWHHGEAAQNVVLDKYTVVLLMTHNYLDDRDLLRFILPSPACYVGALGPKRRLEKLLNDLRNDGYTPTSDELSRLYGPAGFDIGAETPEEIALSIASEIQAVLNDRPGQPLRDRSGSIHEQKM